MPSATGSKSKMLPLPVNAVFHVNSDGRISSLADAGCLKFDGYYAASVIFTRGRPSHARLAAISRLLEISEDEIKRLVYAAADAIEHGHNRNHADAALRALGLIHSYDHIAPADLVPGDYCRAKVPLIGEPESYSVRNCMVVETHGHILQVTTATRKRPFGIHRDGVVGLGWRKA
jgi:hypothetical protein